jgi:general secretion pathway protein G
LCCRSKRIVGSERGFSLIEVVLVVLIMGILSAIAAQKWSGAMEQSRFEATRGEMENLAEAITGNPELIANGIRTDFGYVGDVGALPPNLDALVTNPGGYATWGGPYVQNDFTQNPNDYKQDAWGATYAYTGGVSITSNGSGSAVTKQFAGAASDLTSNSVQGSVTDGLDNPPGDSSSSVSVRITYPNGSGTTTTSTVNPNTGGSYSFAANIPIGNHPVTAIYKTDTVKRYVSVLPESTAFVDFRFPGDLWSGSSSGGGGGGLQYVSGSAASQNSGKDFSFNVTNLTGSSISITSITATYAPAIYYKTIRIAGNTVFDSDIPRGGNGQTKSFSNIDISNGATIAIDYQSFKQCETGGCGNGDVTGVAFTIDFSDGSSVSFTVP